MEAFTSRYNKSSSAFFEKGALGYQDSYIELYKNDKERKNTQEGDYIFI